MQFSGGFVLEGLKGTRSFRSLEILGFFATLRMTTVKQTTATATAKAKMAETVAATATR